MTRTSLDFADLLRALEEHPEWRAELRRLLLPEALLGLPDLVAEIAATVRDVAALLQRLAEAQQRMQQELAALAEAQRRTQAEVAELRTTVAGLAEAQRRTEQTVAGLVEGQRRLEEALAELAANQLEFARTQAQLLRRVERLEDRVGRLVGESVERRYRERAAAYFGRWLRRVEVLEGLDRAALLDEAVAAGRITGEERAEVLWADVVVRGVSADGQVLVLVVEASATVDEGDVRRAVARAELMGRAVGVRTVPVVAGEELLEGVTTACQEQGVRLVVDGRAGQSPWTPAEA